VALETRLRWQHNDSTDPNHDPENNMGLLDGLLGGAVGAEMVTVVNSLIQQHGGVQGVLSQLESQGLGGVAKSWISNAPNQPISPAQVHQVFGSDMISQLAAKAGMNPQDLASKLSQLLPAAIDKLTPAGSVPTPTKPA
jgi:uncharacterized protein YidB (DUF937 family)